MRLQNAKETAAQMGLSEWAVKQGARSGRFPYVTSGRKYLFDVDVLTEILHNEMMERRTCSKEQSSELA